MRKSSLSPFFVGAVVLVGALGGGLVFFVHHLDSPWVKRHVQGLGRGHHLELDYQTLNVELLSGMKLEGLTLGPDLAQVGRLEATWSLASLFGAGPKLRSLIVENVSVTVVQDEQGHSSLDAFSAPASSPPRPSSPLSALPRRFLSSVPLVGEARVSGLKLNLLRTTAGKITDRYSLQGLQLHMAASQEKAGWRVRLNADAPSGLILHHQGRAHAGVARLVPLFALDANPTQLRAELSLRVTQQDFLPALRLDELVHAAVSADFDADHHRTEVSLEQLSSLDGTLTAQAKAELADGDAARILLKTAQGELDLKRLLQFVPLGEAPLSFAKGAVHWRAEDFAVGGEVDGRGRGTLSFEATLEDARVSVSGDQLTVRKVQLGVSGTPAPGHAVAGVATLDVFELAGKGAHPVVLPRAHAELRVTDLHVDLNNPIHTRAHATAGWRVGSAAGTLKMTKGVDDLTYALSAQVPSLGFVRRYAPPAAAPRGAWEKMALELHSEGKVQGLSAAAVIRQRSTLRIERPAWVGFAANAVELALESHGDALRHQAELELKMDAVRLQGISVPAPTARLSFDVDRAHPSAHGTLNVTGLSTSVLTAQASQEPKSRRVSFTMEGKLTELKPLEALIAPGSALSSLDLSKLVLAAKAHGEIRIGSQPLLKSGAEGEGELLVSNIFWQHKGDEVDIPTVALHAQLRSEGSTRTLKSNVQVDSVHISREDHQVDLGGLRDDLTATLKARAAGFDGALVQRLTVRSVQQDYAPHYRADGVSLTLEAQKGTDGTVHLSTLRLDNAAGGTFMSFTGNVDLGQKPRRMSLRGELHQDVARIWSDAAAFIGRGQLLGTLRVDSPDLEIFRTASVLELKDVNLHLPDRGVTVESLNGEVPITVDLDAADTGVAVLRATQANPYWMLRFADQHPLLARASFFTLKRLSTPYLTVAPLAGSLKVEQNVISLSQLEMGMRGGRVTGQCTLDWKGEDSTLVAHLRATNVQSSHGEPFDGNAAFVFSARERNVDGRAEILRMGKRHLLDILDLQDPHRTDVAINRIRHSLTFGYPDRVHIESDHGFANVRVTLGGLGKFITVGELRGIPTGPLIDRTLDSMSNSEEE